MCVLRLPMSQVMSNTSVRAITDFCRGAGAGGARDHAAPTLT